MSIPASSSPSDSRLPNLVIIGAMKSGTSSLHRYLRTHPEISMSDKKETDWFKTDDHGGRDLDWYLSQFEPGHAVRGEASPNYSKRHLFPGVPERIHAVVPDARLLYLVRDPVDRAVSNFVHGVDKGRKRLDEFAETMAPGPGGNTILDTSRYDFQLSAFLGHWDLEHVLVVASEDLRQERRATLRRIFAFLEVDEDFDSDVFDKVSHVSARKFSDDESYQRPVLEGPLRDEVVDYLRPDVAAFRARTGQDFAAWSL